MIKQTPTHLQARGIGSVRTESDEEIRVPPRVPSEALLGKRGELIIVHAGREYRLRRTSLGKLMLTA
jgi:hemin uptake protein HemP